MKLSESGMLPDHGGPRLLVSVRNASEALEAIAGGANIVDVKEPSRGPLGRADAQIIEAIAETTRTAGIPLTAALGEWHENPPASWLETSLPHLSIVKVGLSAPPASPSTVAANESHWKSRVVDLAEQVRAIAGEGACRLVLTAYADHLQCGGPGIPQVLEMATIVHSPFLLIDTYVKNGSGFWTYFDRKRYSDLLQECEEKGIGLAVAGSLDIPGIVRLMQEPPAVIAVRGAACARGDRSNTVSRSNVAAIVSAIKSNATALQQEVANRN